MLHFRSTCKLDFTPHLAVYVIILLIFGVKQYNVFHCYVVLSAKNEEMRIPGTLLILL